MSLFSQRDTSSSNSGDFSNTVDGITAVNHIAPTIRTISEWSEKAFISQQSTHVVTKISLDILKKVIWYEIIYLFILQLLIVFIIYLGAIFQIMMMIIKVVL